MDSKKLKFLKDVDPLLSDNMKRLISLIDGIIETNDSTVLSVFQKIESNKEEIDFIYSVIEYAGVIRPLQIKSIISLYCLLAEKHGYDQSYLLKHQKMRFFDRIRETFHHILVNYGMLHTSDIKNIRPFEKIMQIDPDDDLCDIIMQDDVDSFTKRSAENDFYHQPGVLKSTINHPILYIKTVDDYYISYLQIMAFCGALKCFKIAIVNDSIDLYGVEYYAVAGGNIEIVHILEQKNVSFGNCFQIAIKYHRNELADWILMHYNCNYESFDSIGCFNYKAVIYSIVNEVECEKLAMSAVYQGNFEIIKYLFGVLHLNIEYKSEFVSLSSNDYYGTPLFIAVCQGNFEKVKYFYEVCHANAEAVGKRVYLSDRDKITLDGTPLHVAVYQNETQIVKYLLEVCQANIDACETLSINKRDVNGTVFFVEAVHGNLEKMKCLFDIYHANVDISGSYKDKNGINIEGTPLFVACINGNIEMMKYLVDTCHANIEKKGKFGSSKDVTPLFMAVKNGNIEIMKYFIENCHADVETKGKYINDDGISIEGSLLFLATNQGNLETIKYLIDVCHVDFETKGKYGYAATNATPLYVATEQGNFELIKYFVDHCHADVETRSKSALANAVKQGNIEFVKYLANFCNADVETKIKYKVKNAKREGTALFIATENGNIEIIKYLVEECHADVKTKGTYGNEKNVTPLSIAKRKGYTEITKYFVDECHADK